MGVIQDRYRMTVYDYNLLPANPSPRVRHRVQCNDFHLVCGLFDAAPVKCDNDSFLRAVGAVVLRKKR
jgi:hypothetical protein